MITVRRSADRGHANHGWLDTYHSFSFADYYDEAFMGYRALRVINEDRIAPGAGFPTHGHRDMEIVTYVVEGSLRHRDSEGHEADLRHGEVQRMSAGRGILHSEFNPSRTEPLWLLQIWLLPTQLGTPPSWEQREFPRESHEGHWCLLASPDGADDSLTIGSDVRLYTADLAAGQTATVALASGHGAWVQLIRGRLEVEGATLLAGDGAALEDVSQLHLRAAEPAELLLFDLG